LLTKIAVGEREVVVREWFVGDVVVDQAKYLRRQVTDWKGKRSRRIGKGSDGFEEMLSGREGVEDCESVVVMCGLKNELGLAQRSERRAKILERFHVHQLAE
jgi:hypothetical protein